ncbi:hypothetical protein HO173_004018 [Letharia columbiana]|uniref:Uncharacterized protein n=1 Tax=Letharia columbiana TaxID=112416 RepID=A0A8H6L6Y6_9LECA|nr:uncharacterized protein HO173_004018 [Letharia columbiana]KAF6237817.1 hypothetical protein HO173_004018 [Letharia columbiana]
MASRILRLSTRSPASLQPLRYPFTPPIFRRSLTTTYPRFAEGDLGNPQSSSSDQAQLKKTRGTEGANSPDTASVQQPVSERSAIPGDKDEGTPTEDAVKRNPEGASGEEEGERGEAGGEAARARG